MIRLDVTKNIKMQNVGQNDGSDSLEDVKTMDVRQARLTPPSGSPVIEKAQVLAALQQNFMDLSASDEEEASEVNTDTTFYNFRLIPGYRQYVLKVMRK